MGKKNLDRLFQEKFKDFSEVPDDKVWRKISTSLDAKHKKRRVIPFWLKLGGVAALLAVAIYLINPFDSSKDGIPAVTGIEKSEEDNTSEEINRSNPFQNAHPESEDAVADVDSDAKGEENDTSKEEELISTIDTEEKEDTPFQSSAISKTQKSHVVQNGPTTRSVEQGDLTHIAVDKNSEESVKPTDIVQNNSDEGLPTKELEEGDLESQKELLEDNLPKSNNTGIAKVGETTSEEVVEKSEKKSIYDEIEEHGVEEPVASEAVSTRWAIGANIAPVYFNSIGEGSPIHSSFTANSKSGNVNLSYGLSVAYALSKKLSIRSGINKVDYGYDTNDVEFSPSLAASNSLEFAGGKGQFENIDYATNSESLVVESMDGFSAPIKEAAAAPELTGKSTARTGIMGQQFGYLEIPLELNYALLDKRFGVNLVGGLSSLFLMDNSVIISSGDLTTEIGEANNLNSVNFSGNIGFGVNYKFTSKIQLNVEPVFKYQLNTFSNTAGDFQPFSIGVYSGLNFRF